MSDLNDPRVFFAAERTLLAWTRTTLTLMAFGFVIERFGLFVHILMPKESALVPRAVSFWAGSALILLGAVAAVISTIQYRGILRTLKPVEIPEGYWIHTGVITNLLLALVGIVVTVYFFYGLR
jgi:putative membrane protein